MTFENLLINTCTVKRFAEGAQDDYGIPAKTWNDLLVDEPCRLVWIKAQEIKMGAEVALVDIKLFIGDVDITEQDRVLIDGETYEVLQVTDHQDQFTGHHKQCYLQVVK